MGMHLGHNIRILKIKSKKFFLRPDLAPLNLLFFQCLLRQVGLAPSWTCHAHVFLAPNSWDPKLSANVSFVSVLATVLSEYWKKQEKIFFWNNITLRRLWKLYNFEKNSQTVVDLPRQVILNQNMATNCLSIVHIEYMFCMSKIDLNNFMHIHTYKPMVYTECTQHVHTIDKQSVVTFWLNW